MPGPSSMLAFWPMHPALAAAGLAAASLPVLLHLWNRRQPRQVPWAAMEFLRRAYRRTSRRLRFEQLLLLTLRVAAVALAGIGLSRPLAGTWLHSGRSGQHILLIDNSRSMGQRLPSGQSSLDRARQVARELVQSAEPGEGFAVITLAEPARLICDPITHDHQSLLDRLDRIGLTSAAADLTGGLSLAARVASDWKASPTTCEAILLSAAAGRAWVGKSAGPEPSPDNAARQLASAARMTFAQVGAPRRGNVAITSLQPVDRTIAPLWPAAFRLELANQTDRPLADVAIDVLVNGRVEQTLHVDRLAAGTVVARIFEQTFPAPGQYALQAELHSIPGDVLAEDDRRPLAIEVADRIAVLVVSGGAAEDASREGPAYLAAALGLGAAGQPADSGLFAGRVVPAADLAAEPLSDYDIVFLQDVPALAPEQWRRLRDFVVAGRGLLICAGPHVQAEHYNSFTVVNGGGPVPARIASPARAPESAEAVRFARPAPDHPALSELAGNPDTGFYQSRVDHYLRLQELDAQTAVPLRYSTGEPALVERPLGAGRVLLFTTSGDMSWTNLPARGDFVALLLELAQYLAPDRIGWRNLTAEQPVRIPLAPAEARSQVVLNGPAGTPAIMSVRAVDGTTRPTDVSPGWEATLDEASAQGFYEAHAGSRTVLVAKQGDASESDLRAAAPDVLKRRLGESLTIVDASDQPLQRTATRSGTETAAPFLILAALLLLVETWLASTITRREARPAPRRREGLATTGGVA